MKLSSIILSAFIAILSCSAKQLPPFIKKCKRGYPQINKCLIERIEELRPRLAKGIPEMKLPALDPLVISKVEINTANETVNGLHASFTNVTIYGLYQVKIIKLDFDLENLKIDWVLHVPKLSLHSMYSITGQLLILTLDSSGPSEANITNVNSTIHCDAAVVEKKGQQYLDVSNNTGSLLYDKPKLYFYNLFANNEELTAQTNQVLNDNIEELEKEMKPYLGGTVHQFIASTISNVFNEYSLDELFD